ncbi:hypothetical protein E1B28_013476 [Marasmius oreades]|uniref:Aromatic prenyltransferase n=1 Tax=Marasmius oreades TaxID=181124 RepID=A0A9P7UN20_9AGAR|nr:uncharacterized protein E1B28_013476 [Marasmius oreades]KAG7087515.1 hypothetical protein E1B28_013476 [Marasmius oreades]
MTPPAPSEARLSSILKSVWNPDKSLEQNAKSLVHALYGEALPDVEPSANKPEPTGLKVLDVLANILTGDPSNQSYFYWQKVVLPFAQMLDTSNYPLPIQIAFVLFVYARVVPFLGPDTFSMPPSIMTLDGSPIELSWIIPSSNLKGPTADDKPNRTVRFAIEPRDPMTGKFHKGARMLDYYISQLGNFGGMVKIEDDGMLWRRKIEKFMFPEEGDFRGEEVGEEVLPGSRFMLGMDFNPSGVIVLKAYYVAFRAPPWDPASPPLNTQSPVFLGDIDLSPFRKLAEELDSSLVEPFDLLMEYTNSIDKELRPAFEIVATDCLTPSKNRLKIYCRTMKGTSWDDAKNGFTLGGRLNGPEMEGVIKVLETLWDTMFPDAIQNHSKPLERSKDVVKAEKNLHPLGGLLYYYEFVPGQNLVFPKVYLPIRVYSANDLNVCEALERFYRRIGLAEHLSEGWFVQEVSKSYSHRPLDTPGKSIQTYMTFSMKKHGWELTSYFSPEVWLN